MKLIKDFYYKFNKINYETGKNIAIQEEKLLPKEKRSQRDLFLYNF